uniref:Protein SCAF11-like n=1 Tax=Sinocyclocheilus grahami TaxID=75366 RepID=A0A672T8L1_SINGR
MQEGPGKGGQSSDESLEEEEAQRCPICLNRPRRTERAVPDCCRHVYCLDCIRRWAQMVQSCPVDRRPFSVIYLQGSSQQCIKLPVKAPRLSEPHKCCSQDDQQMCSVSVGETGSTERTPEKRANAKLKCHRKCMCFNIDSCLNGDSCHSLLLTQHCHSSLPSQHGATVGTLTAGSFEVCEEGPGDVQWRRLERKRRWLPTSVPAPSADVSRVSLRSHLLLSAVSASLNVLLSEHTVPHGLVCAVTCPKGEEKKGTRSSGSKTSVKPAEAAATRRSSRHSRSEAEDSSATQSETTDSDTTSSTPQTINDAHASTSRGQQGNNSRSGAKMRGRPKKVKVARPEDEEQETEVGNHEEDGVTEETESKESKTDKKASSDQIDGDQVTLDMEEKMEVENQTSPAEDERVSPDASSQEEETAKVEVVTETMVEDEDNQILPQEDSKQEVDTNDQDLVELVNVPPIQEQDCPSPSCVELQESQSDSQDSESSLQAEPTAGPPTDASDQIADLKTEPDTTENCLDKQESSSPPPLKEDQAVEASVPEEKGGPESKDTNASSPQDNTDLIPMECDSPVSESEANIAEARVVPIANVPQMDDQEPKLDSCKEEKGSDKREREGRSRRSRFHSPTTTWSPNRESRNEGSRRSRSRSRDRSHKTRSTSRSREQQEEARDGRRNRSRSRERSRRRRSRSRNRNRPGQRSPSQERADHGSLSPRKRESWGGDGWRSRGSGRGFRNSNWRNNVEKPGHFSSREPILSDNGNFHEASPDRGRSENPDWVQEREKLWADTDSRGREPRRDENAGDPPAESWPRGSWNEGHGRGGAHWMSSQQGEPADNWRQRTSFSGTANNADSYNRFNDNRAGGKRRESDGAETPLDRSGWSSASSWAIRRTLPADVQNYYSRRDRGGGNNNWNRQEEDQGAPGVPKQADPPQNEPNAPLPTEAVPAMPPPLMPHQMGVMGVLHYPMGPLLPRPPAVGLQPPPQFSLPPQVPVQLHPTRTLLQVPSIAVQGLPPPPPPPPPMQQCGFTVVPSESHPAQQVMPSFPVPGKGSFKPMPTKVVPGPPRSFGTPSAAQPSSTTTQPTSHSKAHADSSKKEKASKLQIQERAVNEVKAAIKPYYQKNEINKEEYKEIVRKAVEKVTHSKSGEVNADKVANLVKAYVDKYKSIRKNKTEKS